MRFIIGFVAGAASFWALTTAPVREALVGAGKVTAQAAVQQAKEVSK